MGSGHAIVGSSSTALDSLRPLSESERVATHREFSEKERKQAADSGAAMPDGSYPIKSRADLENAVQAFGRNPTDAVKAHIKKRAAALGAEDALPKKWKGGGKAMHAIMPSNATPATKVPYPFNATSPDHKGA